MDISSVTPADASAYWHLRLEALETEPDAFGESADEHRATTVAAVAARLASDTANNFVLGGFVDGALVGTAAVLMLLAACVEDSARLRDLW